MGIYAENYCTHVSMHYRAPSETKLILNLLCVCVRRDEVNHLNQVKQERIVHI